jgi:RNA polymerase sigma-70 factor (ECF subfamily)
MQHCNTIQLKTSHEALVDEATFAEWVKATEKYLIRFCRQFVNDWAEAEDMAQEAYIRAWQKRNTFNSESSLLTWQMAIARRVCLDRLRVLRRMIFTPFDERRLTETQTITSVETKIDVQRALLKLNEKDRAILYLRAGEDLAYETIAQIMGRSPETCRKRYERAKERFEAAYGGKEE